MRLFGSEGMRLWRLSRGMDARTVNPDRDQKVVSAEMTFEQDIGSFAALERLLWQLSERVSARLKLKDIAGSTITLKLKTADFRIRTRARSLQIRQRSPTRSSRPAGNCSWPKLMARRSA